MKNEEETEKMEIEESIQEASDKANAIQPYLDRLAALLYER